MSDKKFLLFEIPLNIKLINEIKKQFILTVSIITTNNSFKNHSGIGKIKEFMTRTMSLYESLERIVIIILTAGTKAYQFDDNVYVVPITTLKD